MNIIIPLAGISVFNSKDFFYPPPLIEVNGLPLIQYTLESLKQIEGKNTFIYILKEEDCLKFYLDSSLRLLTPNCEVIILKSRTKGSVCSILMAVDKLNKDDESIIVNADQIFDYNLNKTISKFRSQHSDAGVISFESVHPRWSYVKTDNEDNILQTAEKKPISKNAIAGFYYFKSFSLFIESAFNAIEIEDYYKDNLYTSALINQLILLNKKVTNYKISPSKYKSFYSPQKIKEFKGILKKNEK